MSISHFSATDVGKVRRKNEDAHLVLAINESPLCLLASVCDGVGGAKHGEVASQTAVDALRSLVVQGTMQKAVGADIRQEILEMSVKHSHQTIMEKSQATAKYYGMACTMVSVIADPSNLGWLNVGDSRFYTCIKQRLVQVSRDQTMANALVDSGHLTEAEALTHPRRNTLQYCLGVERRDRPMVVQTGLMDWNYGDKALLCSDGLSDMVSDSAIEDCMNSTTGQETADTLLRMALKNGGRDNITLVVLENHYSTA